MKPQAWQALCVLQANGHQLVTTYGPDLQGKAMVERILALCLLQSMAVDAAPIGCSD
jgi:hypothetical protein